MVAYLQNSEGSEVFHQIIYFLTTSDIRYAPAECPTIYVSLIEQFWQTASASTLENGDMEITATIDGKVKVVSEASIRRHLKLEDSDGISTLPTSEIFEQLALMGYVSNFDNLTFQKGYFSPQWKFLIHTILHCSSSNKTAWEQFSSNITTAIICLATNRTFNFSKFLMYTHVAEEAATMPHDSPLLRVHSLGSDEGSMTLNELTVLCTTLSKKVETLESDLKQTKLTYGAAYTKLIMKVKKLEHKVKSSKARRRVRLVVSEDEDELEDPSKQGRKIAQIDEDEGITLVQMSAQTQGRHEHDFEESDFEFIAPEEDYTAEPDISTANVPVSTAGAEVSTASPEVKTAAESLVYIRRSAAKRKDKGKAIMKEAEPVQKKTKLQLEQERLGLEEALRLQEQLDEEERQRIARVHEEASTFNAEEWDNIQAQIEADEELAHRLQAQERERYSEADKARLLVELINERKRKFAQQRAEQRRNKPMTQAQQRTYMCNYIKNMGSHTLQQLKKLSFDEVKELFETIMKRVKTFTPKESDDTVPKVAAGSSKIDDEQELNQERSKRQKIGEGSEPAEESKDELSQEQLQQLMIIVPEEGMNVEALQTKYPIIDWEAYTKDSRKDDLVKLWNDDTLWKLQRYMHDPLKWRLYDTCVVHHVSTERGHDIFMLVEKDYPLTIALMTLMICNKLQVDEYSVMADELLRKIFILANRPRYKSTIPGIEEITVANWFVCLNSEKLVSRVFSLWSNPNKEPKLGRSCMDELGTVAGKRRRVAKVKHRLQFHRRHRVIPILFTSTNVIQNHPLRFSIAASSSVPWIYLGQFWHILQEDGSKYRFKFVLDRKEIIMTLNDFRRIFHLPQATDNNHERFIVAPKFSEMVPFFLNTLGFTLELRSPSNFKMTGLHLIVEEIEKLVEGSKNVENVEVDSFTLRKNDNPIDPGTRLEPRSDKESLEVELTAAEQPVNVNEEEQESAEDDYESKQRGKVKHVDESRSTPSPTTTRSHMTHSTLISSNTEKL
ncbi:hypothetical protein Tco_0071383 [Tanacetum coccineum]